MARTYASGRPTTGWQKSKRISSPEQVKPGDVLIGVSHQFEAENLYLVIPASDPPTPHESEGFHVRYVQPDLTPTHTDFQPQWVWGFMLAGPDEWYRGIRREPTSGEKEQEPARKLRRVWTTGKHNYRGRSDWTLTARTHEQRIACGDQSLVSDAESPAAPPLLLPPRR